MLNGAGFLLLAACLGVLTRPLWLRLLDGQRREWSPHKAVLDEPFGWRRIENNNEGAKDG